jgi:hypothetical protein
MAHRKSGKTRNYRTLAPSSKRPVCWFFQHSPFGSGKAIIKGEKGYHPEVLTKSTSFGRQT